MRQTQQAPHSQPVEKDLTNDTSDAFVVAQFCTLLERLHLLNLDDGPSFGKQCTDITGIYLHALNFEGLRQSGLKVSG